MQDWLKDEELGKLTCVMKKLVKPFEKGILPERSKNTNRGTKAVVWEYFQKLCHLIEQRMKFYMPFSERYYLNIMCFGGDAKVKLPMGS